MCRATSVDSRSKHVAASVDICFSFFEKRKTQTLLIRVVKYEVILPSDFSGNYENIKLLVIFLSIGQERKVIICYQYQLKKTLIVHSCSVALMHL